MEVLTQGEVRKILEEFKKGIKSILKNKLADLILFGSYARGDYEFGSDIDVLLLTRDKLTAEENKKISELSSTLSLRYDVLITCLTYPHDAYQNWETPFLMNVRKEGVSI